MSRSVRSNEHWRSRISMLLLCACACSVVSAQNSMVGDGFGGRLWYRPTNYTVGSYTGFSLCFGDPCDSASNQLYGWGGDYYGELAMDTSNNGAAVPVPIPGMTGLHYYSTGYGMGAIKLDGSGWVWGNLSALPMQVLTNAKFVDASTFFLSFVKNDGTVWSIGVNGSGEFGDGTNVTNTTSAVQMLGVSTAMRVANAYDTQIVLLADGTVFSTGSNANGLLGDGSGIIQRNTVGPIPGLDSIVDIKAHSYAVAALRANGDVYTWGSGSFIGDGNYSDEPTPKRLAGLHDIVAISGACDGGHFLALDKYRNCYAWGENSWGQTGSNVPQDQMVLTPTMVATDVIDIMAGESFSYIVKSDGSLWAAGSGSVDMSNMWNLPDYIGSIWLGIPDQPRHLFTQLDPSSIGACPLVSTTLIPTVDCSTGTGTIAAVHTDGAAPYTYDIGNGQQNDSVFTGLANGTYTVTVTDANGCATTASAVIDLSQGPTPYTSAISAVFCSDDGYTLPSGAFVEEGGLYYDTLHVAGGCDTLTIVELQELPLIQVYIHDSLCPGEAYILPSGAVVTEVFTYADTVHVPNACDTVYYVILHARPGVEATASATDTVITGGASTQLHASGGPFYSWSPATGLDLPASPDPIARPITTTTYCVSVTNSSGCTDTACVKVEVRCPALFIPSAFSPNASGTNDILCVEGNDCIAFMLFRIYNRWGNKVFETMDPKTCWDGLHNGQPLNAGVFVYHLNATLSNGETVEQQGNITLVR